MNFNLPFHYFIFCSIDKIIQFNFLIRTKKFRHIKSENSNSELPLLNNLSLFMIFIDIHYHPGLLGNKFGFNFI